MATTKDYPSYLPADWRGLPSIQEGNQRYYYKVKDGKNMLMGSIVGKRHLIIRFPEGSTIDVIPPDSVDSQAIIDGSVQMVDLNDEVKSKIQKTYNEGNETLYMNFDGSNINGSDVGQGGGEDADFDTGADDGSDDI